MSEARDAVLDVEQLFEAEADLRKAARDHSTLDNNTTRKRLREAARYYAKVVDFFQGKD